MFGLLNLILSFAILIPISKNPVSSIISLVLAFVASGIILFYLSYDYIALTLLLVYVGAIMVLFLFVVMLTNTGIMVFFHKKKHALICLFFLIFFIFEFYINTSSYFLTSEHSLNFLIGIGFENFLEFFSIEFFNVMSTITTLGYLIFFFLPVALVLAGIILLLAMLGAIVLSLGVNFYNFNNLSSNNNFLTFLIKKKNF